MWKFSKINSFILCCAGSLAWGSLSAGTIAVDFGGTKYSQTTLPSPVMAFSAPVVGDYDFDGSPKDVAASLALDEIFSPIENPKWVTPEGKNGPGLRVSVSIAVLGSTEAQPSDLLEYLRYRGSRERNLMQATTKQIADERLSMASMYYYFKHDFLNGLDKAQSLSFDAADKMSTTLDVIRGNNKGVARFLVKNGSAWYVSVDSIEKGDQKTLSITPATSHFYVFDPNANARFFNVNNAGNPVAGSTFTDIQAFGVHLQHLDYDGGSAFKPYQFVESFLMTATP